MRSLGRRLLAELIGTALLAVAVVGSGIAAARLSPYDAGLQLLETAAATSAALVAIILAVGPVSGAHLNPVVTVADRLFGGLTGREAVAYVGAQVVGALLGVVVANLMFGLPAIQLSQTTRSGGGMWLGELVATFGLVLVVFGVVRSGRMAAAPFAVGAYIGAASWFASSTSFGQPSAHRRPIAEQHLRRDRLAVSPDVHRGRACWHGPGGDHPVCALPRCRGSGRPGRPTARPGVRPCYSGRGRHR